MNIQRFILPGSVAAALHVALLWAWPREEFIRIVAVPLAPADPLPPKPAEPVSLPPEPKDPSPNPVQPLAGGPTPPDIPEEIVVRKPDQLAIPVDDIARHPSKETRIVPKTFGPGDLERIGAPAGIGPSVFRSDQLDRTPAAKVRVAPDYPFALKNSGIAGSVVVEFDVTSTGQVSGARVVRSTRREFEEPTLRAVLKWRFEPGRKDGRAVPFRMVVPVEFTLEE